jgi:hypothetical protein
MSFFILTAVSMVVLGVLSAASVVWSKWGDSGGPVPVVRPPLS